ERLVLAGSLSVSEAFVAGVRSSVYDLCLPMSTAGLQLVEAAGGAGVGALGVASLVLDELVAPETIDAAVQTTFFVR
ncbi:MAG: hypothetical protein KIT69_17875, partial [Propionibacteriaceae bacterium]|nr:hypothetical protein [Propionibacteriaceae bacterium]